MRPFMFSGTVIRGVDFRPARFCAPLAGLTHSAFRRLVAEFGGCGAFFTEMLSAKRILHEDVRRSPYLRRSPGERRVIYQLMVLGTDRLDQVVGRLAEVGPDGLDINLACHAPLIRQRGAGSGLFENPVALAAVLREVRRLWPGLLTVKIRLGRAGAGAEDRLAEGLRRFEDNGVDAIILHPRYFEDKFKRRVRHEWLAWVAARTRLPLVANGDITSARTVAENPDLFRPACALMIGRMAVARPWLFAAWERELAIDYAAVWERLCDYVCEDFPESDALARIKLFTKYYARNFLFGHHFHAAVHNAATVAAARARAADFFSRRPALDPSPSLMGL